MVTLEELNRFSGLYYFVYGRATVRDYREEERMATIERPKCPDARRSWFAGTDTCDLVGKMCLLESGTECSIYDEFLAEAEAEFDVAWHDNVEGK